jgi:lysophospholipase L1-like esterase
MDNRGNEARDSGKQLIPKKSTNSGTVPATFTTIMASPLKTLILAASLVLSTLPVRKLEAGEPLKVHPENPHVLMFRGKPQVLVTVAEHYGSVVNTDFNYTPYLEVMKRDKMNLTRLFLAGFRHDNRVPPNDPLAPTPNAFLQPWERTTNGELALDGLGKWDFTTWNTAFFQRLDAFLQACSERGIVVELTFFSTYYTPQEWKNSPFHPGNNLQGYGPGSQYDSFRLVDSNLTATKEAYIRKIVREVNRFDNIYFEIQNEPFWNEPNVKDDEEVDFHNRMLEVIREEEAALPNKHLVAQNFPQQSENLSIDFDIINEHYPGVVPGSPVAGTEILLRDQYSRGKILATGEADTTTEPQARLESWMFLLGGGVIYNGLAFTNTIYTSDDEAGDNQLGNSMRRSIANAAQYVGALNQAALQRDLSWVSGGIPQGAKLQAMATPGQQYAAYFHHGKTALTNFQTSYNPIDDTDHIATTVVTLPEGSWRAVWTRPADLEVIATEEFDHEGGEKTLSSVIYQADVALRIDRTGDGDETPPPSPSGLNAVPDADGSVRLSWTPSDAADIAFYRIYRSDATGVSAIPEQLLVELDGTTTDFIDDTVVLNAPAYYTVTAVDLNGNESQACDEAGATSALQNAPFGGTARAIPGIIQAEDFDMGGQDIAYADLSPENEGAEYREYDGVDIRTTTDVAGAFEVFSTLAGEWLEYSVVVEEAGVYRLDLRTANTTAGAEVSFDVDGIDVSGVIQVPESSDESGWQTVVVPELVLPKGTHILRLAISQSPTDELAGAINSFEITHVSKTAPTADAGPDQEAIDADGFATVLLDASASVAGDAPISNYSWKLGSAEIATGISPEVLLPVGDHTILMTVTDAYGLMSSDTVTIRIHAAEFVNGSFEANFDGWTVTGNLAIVNSLPYVPSEGQRLVAFNNDQRTPNGSISQSFATLPGQTYLVAFDMGLLAYNDSLLQLNVSVVGNSQLVSQSYTIKRINGVNVRWENKSFIFTADSKLSTITFRDTSAFTDSLDLTLDNVSIVQQVTRALSVESSPDPGAPIIVSLPDNDGLSDGIANFTRSYPNAVTTQLTAPKRYEGFGFSKWRRNGTDYASTRSINVLMNNDHTFTAVYVDGLPTITEEPVDIVVEEGGEASFHVTANGFGTLAYQWRFNGTPIFGQTSDTLTIPNVSPENAGNYDVVVTNLLGSEISSTASLEIPNTAVFVNGSFESGFAGWTTAGNLVIQSSAPYTATDGAQLVAFNGGQTTPNGTISQTFGTVPGRIYQLTFDFGVLAFNDSPQSLRVDITGNSSLLSQTYTTNRINGVKVRWESKSLFFTANSISTTLTFRDVSATTDSLDLTLDNVRLIPQVSRTLTVASSPLAGAAVTVSPLDKNGLGNGTSSFTRVYSDLVNVSLTAAATNGTHTFSKWTKNGIDLSTDRTVNVVMNADFTLTAVYLAPPPVITRTLTVQSLPAAGVSISITPADNDSLGGGATDFTRLYPNGTSVSLIAPINHNGLIFSKWQKDGRDLATTAAVSVQMNADLTLTAVYVEPPPVIIRTLTVQSSPAAGVTISVSPADNDSEGNGTTDFTRLYTDATTVTLTAPNTFNGLAFSKWQKNGLDFVTTPGTSVAMDADQTLTAVYVDPPPVITVHPDSLSLAAGDAATFNVVASGASALSYQWRFNGIDIPGEDSSELAIADVQQANVGNYDVVVSSAGGSVTSNPASLTIPNTAPFLNGSFEDGFDGWTRTGNMTIQSSAPYAATDGIRQVAFNSGQLIPNGVLSQTFGTTPGQLYQLTFDMGVIAFNNSQQRLQVELAGSSVLVSQTHVTNRINGAIIRWESKTINFTANSTATTLTFRDLSSVTDSLDLTLDKIRLVPQITRTLTVRSTPTTGLTIGVSPAGNSGQSNGSTDFTRLYPNTATVSLNAPALVSGFRFSKWQKNGVDFATDASTSVVMDADHTLTAVYTEFTPALPSGLKIMPLGDSITYGLDGTNAGYRGFLYSLLTPDAPGFQFIGTKSGNSGSLPSSPLDQRRHQALGGYRIQDIANNLDGFDSTRYLALGGSDLNPDGGYWLTGGNGTGRTPLYPDVITMMIGTNDLGFQTGVESRLRNLVTKLTTLRPSSKLMVAKITPGLSFNATINSYNIIVTNVVADFKAAGKNIYLVDLNTGFPSNGYSSDGYHPNDIGFNWMARQWRDAILAAYPAIDPNGPPVITGQPNAVETAVGGNATFKVVAAGTTPFTYQWRFKGIPISGKDSDILVLNNVQPANAGNYDVIVSNGAGPVTSIPATLSVISVATLVNGSFESALDGWTVTGNVQSRTNGAPYSATDGTKIAAFNTSNTTPNGTLSQSFTTAPGATYTLAFDVGVLAYNTLSQQFQVTCTGTSNVLTRNVTVLGPGNGTTRWTPQSFTFTADSSSTVLTFRDISSATNALDLLLDNVRLSDSASIAAAPPAAFAASSDLVSPEPPDLGSVSLSGTPGNFRISLNHSTAGSYVLERSVDLLHWEIAGEFEADGTTPVEFNDNSQPEGISGKPAKSVFYRIGRLPDPGFGGLTR